MPLLLTRSSEEREIFTLLGDVTMRWLLKAIEKSICDDQSHYRSMNQD